jgi:hypothetical protein
MVPGYLVVYAKGGEVNAGTGVSLELFFGYGQRVVYIAALLCALGLNYYMAVLYMMTQQPAFHGVVPVTVRVLMPFSLPSTLNGQGPPDSAVMEVPCSISDRGKLFCGVTFFCERQLLIHRQLSAKRV